MSEIVLPGWLPTTEEQHARELALSRRYYLVRIAGNAGYDTMRCRRCNRQHPYLTLMCEPQPFDGATRGVYAYWHALGVAGAEQSMTPSQRRRFKELSRAFMVSDGLPDLSTSHPRTARQFRTEDDAADIGAIPLGVLEEVSVLVAQRLLDRINAKGPKPPLVVPGLMTNGRLGVLAPALVGGKGALSRTV